MADERKHLTLGYPSWDYSKLKIGSNLFDLGLYRERRQFLINVSDIDANNLNRDDWYDRITYLREDDWVRLNPQAKNESPPPRKSGEVIYKNWIKD
jgi:hypothetical protein